MKNLKYVLFMFILCFISLSRVNASATCVYDYKLGTYKTSFTCTVTKFSVSCTENAPLVEIASYSDLKVKNFTNEEGLLVCPSKLGYDSNVVDVKTYITIKVKGNNTATLNESKSSSEKKEPEEKPNNGGNNITKPEDGNNNIDDTDKVGDKNDNPYTGELDLEKPCQGAVQGVFTTLGWVFLIIKILVPVILIAVGSIDFFKAVMASKDDEIKKASKTLIVRAIAGIIIFLIPSILEFIVGVFDDSNIYKGSFKDCTECMLNPNHEFDDGTTCSNLRGNQQ